MNSMLRAERMLSQTDASYRAVKYAIQKYVLLSVLVLGNLTSGVYSKDWIENIYSQIRYAANIIA